MSDRRHLYRSSDALIGGVCAGIAEYFSVSPTLVRVIAIVLAVVLCGAPIMVYAILMVVMPLAPEDVAGYVDVPAEDVAAQRKSKSAGRLPLDPRIEEALRAGKGGESLRDGIGRERLGRERLGRERLIADGTEEDLPLASVANLEQAMPGAAYSATYGTVSDAPQAGSTLPRQAVWLIAIGIFTLACIGAATIVSRLLPNISWWNFWPLIIVFCGIMEAISPERRPWRSGYLFSGMAIAALGVVALLCTLDLLGWGVWGEVISLWPWFVIAGGVAIIARAFHSNNVHIGASLICIGVLVLGCMNYQGGQVLTAQMIDGDSSLTANVLPSGTPGKMLNMSGYSNAALDYSVSAADVTISSNVYDAIEVYGSKELIDNSSFSVTTGSTTTNIGVSSGLTGNGATFGRTQMLLPMQTYFDSISVTASLCDLSMDIGMITANSVKLDANVTDANIALGSPYGSATSLSVNSNMSNIDIVVPQGCEAAVQSDAALDGTNLSGFTWDDAAQQWRTSGYAEAQQYGSPCWTIYLEGNLSSICVRVA